MAHSTLVACAGIAVIVFCVFMENPMASKREHIIVVGAGLAGHAAAIEAVNQHENADVTLIEKEKNVGGNSAKASSGINGCGTSVQKKMGIKDSPDSCFSDTVKAGDNANDMDLVDALVHDSVESVEWLRELGVPLDDVNLCGGHSTPRTHWIPSPKEGKPMPVGITIIRALQAHLDSLIKKIQETQPERTVKVVTETNQDDESVEMNDTVEEQQQEEVVVVADEKKHEPKANKYAKKGKTTKTQHGKKGGKPVKDESAADETTESHEPVRKDTRPEPIDAVKEESTGQKIVKAAKKMWKKVTGKKGAKVVEGEVVESTESDKVERAAKPTKVTHNAKSQKKNGSPKQNKKSKKQSDQ